MSIKQSDYAGIDYGRGKTNIDEETGIRYGVIPADSISAAWYDSSESDYGEPTCPDCGNSVVGIDNEAVPDLEDTNLGVDGSEWWNDGTDYACLNCSKTLDSEDCFGDEAIGSTLDDGEYLAFQSGDDYDIFLTKSPYYTHSQFCSPCAPGAGYLLNYCPSGPKTYCFAPDWFSTSGGSEATGLWHEAPTSCPYPVYRVDTNECVFMPTPQGKMK